MKSILLVLTSSYLASCFPPPHPAVVAVRKEEELLPFHLRKPALFNPHLRDLLPLTSLLHQGESPVFEREADNVPRQEIYNILTHAGFINRVSWHHQPNPNYRSHSRHKKPTGSFNQHTAQLNFNDDPPFFNNPDLLQYLDQLKLWNNKMPELSCKSLIKDYCQNSSFVGLRYIADETKHWVERWLWLGLVGLSWYGSALLIVSAWDAFVHNPISFGLDTTYTDWETKMPAVAICEAANDDMIYSVADTIWTPKHPYDLEDALKDVVYFRGISYSLIDLCYVKKNPHPLCPTSNFSYYADLVRSDCPQVMRNCLYNGKPFNCCEYFLPVDSDMGTCFIINSIQTEEWKPFPMVINMKHQRGILKFEILLPARGFTLGEDEVPTVTTLQSSTLKLQPGYIHRRHLVVRNIVNDPQVVQTTPEQRACRFHYENADGLYPSYSYSACTVLCRKREQIATCGCNDHFMLGSINGPNNAVAEEERCNISGMACLHANYNHLTILKPQWANRPGMACNCMPSCDETEITIIKDVIIPSRNKNRKKSSSGQVEMIIARLPTERFKRNVVRSRMDLVVSVGGTCGLFLGASILSFVELIFYFTVRYTTNICTEARKIIAHKNNMKPKFIKKSKKTLHQVELDANKKGEKYIFTF